MTMKLNSAQWDAVSYKNGPVLVLAGPGSGKTTVICERVQYLIEELNVPSNQILVLTYTKAAAESMAFRYQQKRTDRVFFLTIHSFCYHFLLEEYHLSYISILSEQSKLQLIRQILVEQGFLEGLEDEELQKYYEKMSLHVEDDKIQLIKREYQRRKEQKKVMDYDDLLEKTYDCLRLNETIRKKWEERFQYILVDEFQDVNIMQFKIIKLLAMKKRNVMVVGDDDQSIYGFRGARPEIMKEFLQYYQDAKRILLNINYRCSNSIMELAQKSIRNNKERFAKDIIAMRKDNLQPVVREYLDITTQNHEILTTIMGWSKAGISLEECAVFFRTRQECKRFLWQASIMGICCQCAEWEISNFFAVEDIIAYVSLIEGKWKLRDVIQVMNHPDRGIERLFLHEKTQSMEDWIGKLIGTYNTRQAERVREFDRQIKEMRRLPPYLGIVYLFQGVGYEKDVIKRLGNNEFAKELFLTFGYYILDMAKQSRSWEELRSAIEQKIKKHKEQNKKKGIVCMTYHSAKGLEYDNVFLPNLNEGMVPLKKSVMAGLLEEERRLFYVGITRARKRIELSYVKSEGGRTKKKSQFLLELGK